MKKLSTILMTLLVVFFVKGQSIAYDIEDYGYLTQPLETQRGIVVSNNNYSELYLLKDNGLKPMVTSRGCGLYSKVNKTKDLVGFKSINDAGEQAPAILDVNTGKVTLLESYTFQCGQVSFSNDGTVAYTMGEDLIIRKGDQRRRYSLGFYTNLTEISPDATKVAYTNVDGEMFVIDLMTGVSSQITAINMYNPQWSADGTKLSVEKIDGHINVYDFAKARLYELGEGTDARWANNSEYLVYTYTDKVNEFNVNGTAIKKVRFDGAEQATLVSDLKSYPRNAIVLSDNSLLIPYTTGEKRGLRKMALNSRLKSVSAAEENVYTIPSTQKFGHRFNSLRENLVKKDPVALKKASLKGGSIGILDIPYINQVWDTPSDHSGCYPYGHWACAPSTSCMLLGYYGLLPKKAVKSRWTGNDNYYSFYVGRDYKSPNTGFVFNKRASGANGCNNVGGAYGYMWGYASPSSMMGKFYLNNGVNESFKESSWSAFDREVSAGYPYSICLQNASSSGHLVLGFRTNSEVHTDLKVYYRAGSFVCHDPYGDYNNPKYASGNHWDGRYATYDWPGYNNGWKNIKQFFWGYVSRYDVSKCAIKPETSSLSFGGVEPGQSKTLSVKINATELTANISVSCNSSAFQLSTNSIAKTGGTLSVTFKPSAIQSYSGTITLKSSGASDKTISLSGSGKAAPLSFTEYWNLSEQKGNKTSKGYDASNIRNMAYANGKLYVVYDHNKIKAIKAQTGDDLGDLNDEGVNGGVLKFCDVQTVGDKIVACNLSNGTSPFKIYVWDNDNQKPRVLLETTDLGGVKRMGDCFNVWGNLENGTIYLGNDDGTTTRIFEYRITNGVCAKTPRVFNATTDGSKHLAVGNSCRVIPQSVGYWINGKNSDLTRLDNSGKRTYSVPNEVKWGNAFTRFEYKGVAYGAITIFNTPDGVSEHNYTGGRFALLDATNGMENSTVAGEYPSAGLGNTSRNINGTGNVISKVCNNGNGLEMWVLSTTQGMAYFYTGSCPWDEGVEPIKPVGNDPTIVVTATTLDFSTVKGVEVSKSFTVSGRNLKSDINLSLSGANADMFSVSNATISKTSANETVTVKYNPNAEGTHNATLTLTSTDAATKTITLNGTATSDAFNDDVTLTEGWNFSQVSGKTAPWITNGSQVTQDFGYLNGKLYVVHRNGGNDDNTIYIVDAFTGEKKGALNTAACQTGTYLLSSIETIGGKVIAANLATGEASPLVVYIWDNDNAEPRELLRTTTHADVRAGDAMSVSGDLESGKIWFAKGATAYYYEINGGVCETNPIIVSLVKDGKAYNVGDLATNNVFEEEDGTIWVSGKDAASAHFDADGSFIEELSSDAIGASKQGTDFKTFTLGTKIYGLATTYLCKTSSSLSEGALSLIDMTNGVANATNKQILPVNGLGKTRNTSFRSTVCYSIENGKLNVWTLFPNQGAFYSSFNCGSSAIEGVEAEAVEECVIAVANKELNIIGANAVSTEIYSISGGLVMRRANENVIDVNELSGLYIVVVVDEEGNRHVAKVVI